MTKQEVIKVMGNPSSTKADEGVEVLEYNLYRDLNNYYIEPYWVTLKDGKVVRYGRAGDFGSTISPTQNVNLDIHQH